MSSHLGAGCSPLPRRGMGIWGNKGKKAQASRKASFSPGRVHGKDLSPPLSAAVPTLTSSLLYQTNFSDGAEDPNPLISGKGLQLTADSWSLEKGDFPLPPLPRPHSFSQGQSPRRHFCLPAPYLGGGGGHMSQLSRCQNGLFTASTLTLPRLWLAVPCSFTETFCVHALTSGYPYTLSQGVSRL